jgi:uncharacterized protein
MFACAALESAESDLVGVARDFLSNVAASHSTGSLWWRTGFRSARATASDIAWLIEAYVGAFEESGADAWLDPVGALVDHLVAEYWDGDVPTAANPDAGGGVFTSARSVNDLPLRPKEIFDAATPSAHAVVASALGRYGVITENERALLIARRVIALAGTVLNNHPTAVPDLVRAYGLLDERREIVVPGPPSALSDLARSWYVPSSVIVTGGGRSPLLADREAGSAYVCRRETCGMPAMTAGQLTDQLAALRSGD